MSPTVAIGSSGEFSKILSTSSIVITDFFESLSTKYSKPNRITFTKVNVDNQQAIAQLYGVRAMPTFLIFRSGTVIQTIQGADRGGLTTAIENAIKLAGPSKPTFSSAGRTLGGSTPRASLARPFNYQRYIDILISFFGLYFISLFSLDAYKAAEESPFNIYNEAKSKGYTAPGGARLGEKRTGAATQIGKKLGTIADLGGD
ncbi:putative Thioredoxin-like protein [Glarea lozoyensis 74030]|uniref:Putative Thioredoxin-like protein n=1 Tax=Glarea lozoyensis (strain ATCC 74030 / MF5533) TaxID=1104152 RepID=H0EYC5_GLAL7|nr:putative Thioredoxin-like protein [Glarea lozoyensis 74030]